MGKRDQYNVQTTPELWGQVHDRQHHAVAPLAIRMRPLTLDEFVGQAHFLGPGMLLRRMLEADRLTSVIFYGPPGTGKTSLAEVIARHTDCHFERANAAAVGVREVRSVLEQARNRLEAKDHRTIFFLDEIHRFNRAQQDVLLGDVERGVITLIGATTENPFFAINSPLVSRSQIFQFKMLSTDEIRVLIRRAIKDPQRGYGKLTLSVTDEAVAHWCRTSDGDARRALSALEIAVLSGGATQELGNSQTEPIDKQPQSIEINLDVAEQSIQRKALVYDGSGDDHYDAISAFIKSIRGSDPDAAVYWLARMLQAGEDPMFIARRIAILASEDIGNAVPGALQLAAAAYEITHRVGMPECQLTLAQTAIFMASSPKSNASAKAIWSAMSDVKHDRTIPVPKHLRDSHYSGAAEFGHGHDYRYAHDSPTGYVEQDYLGVLKSYYQPTQRGYEKRISEYLKSLNSNRVQSKSRSSLTSGEQE